ncbi:hypothetical protein WOLCODRAFT_135572 [Wolfiporia cocos MD-104 SS10]|uniref:Uncharacterized protein n=1 Tax=Wolfiporia cocos (strain MD-104) TaxID=742152 RepID=A0A2H3JE21_WOLCO|nr:hypothetical protein WOLCODRAFT_135572 [Wolfiporia cocos MD-104 SS10]
MLTLKEIWRGVQTVAVPILFSLIANYFIGKNKSDELPPSLYLPVLREIGFVPRTFPVTYRADAADFSDYERVQDVIVNTPDTTAVLLNWARFPNVLLISSLFCGPWLDDTIAQVIIWNNSPRALTWEDFQHTGCTKSKLKIINAPGNMYFQGRFLACAGASTPYCFIQDDDYLIRPEIIRAMRARIGDAAGAHPIHLLPPHEHLSSALREVHVPARPMDRSPVHTSFAWLGHGALVPRTRADEFLALLRALRAPPDEVKMADNYFTLLSNRVPEIWADQDFPLGGGHAFTVGEEGNARNARHIIRAAKYLGALTRCGAAECDAEETGATQTKVKMPYVTLGEHSPPSANTRAACGGSSCVLETNIKLLPDTMKHTGDSAECILALEAENLEMLGDAGKQHYEEHPLSHAVDTRPETSFQSFGNARAGDSIVLDVLTDISTAHEWHAIEMVWLVDADTERILQASAFDSTTDGEQWHKAFQQPACDDSKITDPAYSGDVPTFLRECSVQMALASDALHLRATGRYFRAVLGEDRAEKWTVHEIFLRGL